MPFLLAKNAALALPIFYHCQRRKSFFFFLLATLLEVHYCVPRVLVLKGYCENCSKQNAQHQDARNRIQGWNYLPRVDVTAAPFNPGWYNSSSQLLDIAHSVMRRTKVAITEKPCCWRKQHQDVKKNFLSIRQLNNGSQLQIVGYSLNLYRHISTYCWGAAWLRQLSWWQLRIWPTDWNWNTQSISISSSAFWQNMWCQTCQMVHICIKLEKNQKVVNLNI